MFGLNNKEMEKIVTKVSIGVGLFIALFSILFIIDKLMEIDFLSNNGEIFGTALMIPFIVLLAGFFISAMLSVFRIANAIEEIKDKLKEK